MVGGGAKVASVLAIGFLLAGCVKESPPLGESQQPTPGVMVFDSSGKLASLDASGVARFVYTGHSGGEPGVAVTEDGTLFVLARNETLRSRDGGASWQVVHTYHVGQGVTSIGTSDPILWVDNDTGRIYVSHLFFLTLPNASGWLGCPALLWSDDDGDTWIQRDGACVLPNVDHQTTVTAVPRAANPRSQDMPVYPNVLYSCYNSYAVALGSSTECSASFDGGLSYAQQSTVFGPQDACQGYSGLPRPRSDGVLALAIAWDCGPLVAVSDDSGLSWTVHAGPPGLGSSATLNPDLAWGPEGELFLLWRTTDESQRLARSRDQGATWDAVWNVTAPGLSSTRFNVVQAGPDGGLALAYLGTSYVEPPGSDWDNDGKRWDHSPSTAPPEASWHLYLVTTKDARGADPVWIARQVTPDDDPVQKGCTWESGGTGGPRACRNLKDFIGAALAPDGTFYVSYTDGCTIRNACAGQWESIDEADARDDEVAIAMLEDWLTA